MFTEMKLISQIAEEHYFIYRDIRVPDRKDIEDIGIWTPVNNKSNIQREENKVTYEH